MGSRKFRRKRKIKKVCKVRKTKKFKLRGPEICLDFKESKLIKNFLEIRENYFNYLQKVIRENLESADDETFPNGSLERISLEVEQQALLACMQTEIYQQIMVNIIHDIRKSTRKKKLHLGIKNILLSKKVAVTGALPKLKTENETDANERTGGVTPEANSHIPTPSSVRTECNECDQDWSDQNVLEDEYESHLLRLNSCNCEINSVGSENRKEAQTASLQVQDNAQTAPSSTKWHSYLSNSDSLKFGSSFLPSTDKLSSFNVLNSRSVKDKSSICQKTDCVAKPNVKEHCNKPNEFNGFNSNSNSYSNLIQSPQQTWINSKNPTRLARSEIGEPVDDSSKDVMSNHKDDRDRAKLVSILEDDVGGEFEDSLSDNCYEGNSESYDYPKREGNLLADRLREMRQIFGVDEETQDEKIKKSSVIDSDDMLESRKCIRRRKFQRQNHMWYHERIIQMYRLALLASEMRGDERDRNRSLFIEYFGEDSDEENETNFMREDKYILSCKERISSWVVKYLMPFYNKKRIIGRRIFKQLGHHVSDSIIQQIKYPDEWSVKYLVTKFFPTDKRFIDESDILSFQIE